MNKQEAIEKIKNIDTLNINDIITGQSVDLVIKNQVINLISQIDEPQKVIIPKFVAEWIEDHKGNYNEWNEEARTDFVFRAINDMFRFRDGFSPWDFAINEKISEWTTKNAYEFITAILFGYEVEKEKRYTVEIPNPDSDSLTVLEKLDDGTVVISQMDVFPVDWRNQTEYQLTEAEIRNRFEWAWQWAKEVSYE